MNTVLARSCLSMSVAVLVATGLTTSASADPGASHPVVDANPFEATPTNPFDAAPAASPAPITAAGAPSATSAATRTLAAGPTTSAPTAPAESAPTATVSAASRPAVSAPAESAPTATATVTAPTTASAATVSAPDAAAPELDMAVLAERAADQPAPPPADQALQALDAVLLDETADPISGVSAPARDDDRGIPSREAVRQAIEAVTPAIRACVDDGQSGRIVSVHSVFTRAGRVAIAEVEANTAHVSPQQRSCMARAARAARTEPFAQERFEVTFPVRL